MTTYPRLYCIECEEMVDGVWSFGSTPMNHVIDVPELYPDDLGIAACYGPFTSCPPPEEGGLLLASDADFEQEEPEPTYEDVHIMQTVDDFLTHIVNN